MGKVKTRIAQTAGNEKALRIYKELLRHTREVAMSSSAKRLLFYSQNIPAQDDWAVEHFEKHLQVNADLGGKMLSAFQFALAKNDKAIIIGSDCANLNEQIINDAFTALEHNDFVVGPTFDGGYYLLGMKKVEPSLFEQIKWSTEEVFPTTIQRIEKLKKSYHLVPRLSDIDYEEDWKKYGWDIK